MSLSDPIVLSVDVANNNTPVAVNLARFREVTDETVYKLPSHTLSLRNLVAFSRTFPKQVGNFRGLARAKIVFTQDVTVVGVDGANIVAPFTFIVEARTPVGVSLGDQVSKRQHVISLLDNDALMEKFIGALEI